MSSNISDLSLHKAVFSEDPNLLEELLKSAKDYEINGQDIHGNTALHIAVMKGNKRCVELLIKSGSITTIRNELNWMPHNEAVSYGDIEIIKLLNDALSHRIHQMVKKKFLIKLISDLKEDFVMKFETRIKDFSQIQTISYPEFVITITKKGSKLRIDANIIDYYHLRPEMFHFIVDLTENSDPFVLITIADIPVYQSLTNNEWNEILNDIFSRNRFEEEILELLQKENSSVKFSKDPNVSQSQLFRKTITKKVGKYKSDIYETQGMDFQTQKRSEHLRAREESNINNDSSVSLPKPTPRTVTWDQYINCPKGGFPYLGRKPIETLESNRVSIVVGLTDEIAVDRNWVLNIFTKLFSDRFIEKVTEFTKELPKGFPVLCDFPLNPSVYLKWKLMSFELKNNIEDSLFVLPENYENRIIFEFVRH